MEAAQNEILVQASILRETPKCLVVRDLDGQERWLDKEHVQMQIVGMVVSFAIDRNKWERRVSNKNVHTDEPPVEMWTRKCLCCGTKQELEKGMFVCDPCKRTDSWRLGA